MDEKTLEEIENFRILIENEMKQRIEERERKRKFEKVVEISCTRNGSIKKVFAAVIAEEGEKND